MALVDDDQANVVRQATDMHRVDAGNQHLGIKAAGVFGLKYAMGDTVTGKHGACLLNQLFAVRQEHHLAALGHRLRDDAGRRQGFATAGRQVEHHAALSPSQGKAGLVLSVELVGAKFKSHHRPLRLNLCGLDCQPVYTP